MSEKLTNAVQENLLVLLSWDDDRAVLIRNTIEYELFDGDYQHIAKGIYNFIDRYKTAPKEHLPDLFEGDFNKNKLSASRYKDIVDILWESSGTVNAEYTINQLSSFVRMQTLKTGIIQAAELIQTGEEDAFSEAESILSAAVKRRLSVFDPGTRINETDKSLAFLDDADFTFPTGIKEFDMRGIGPMRKGLTLYLGPYKSGKTWFMTSVGKSCLMHRHKVLHITLEMPETQILKRYIQSWFAVATHDKRLRHQTISADPVTGALDSFNQVSIEAKLSLDDPDIRMQLTSKIGFWGTRFDNLIVKEFPSGQLTVKGLVAYLDNLEAVQNFIPDIILLDYIDIMDIDRRDYRLALGGTYVDVRGIAGERNVAIVTCSQINRDGKKKSDRGGSLDGTDVAEDFSKFGTLDTALAYNQTSAEKELQLARVGCIAHRHGFDGVTAVIAQNYSLGQYCLDSALVSTKYYMLMDDDT